MTVEIRDFDVDLDIYVAWNDYEGITGSAPVYGESYTWKSNAYGSADESITVDSPEAGPYYIEVCSYTGEASPYELETSWR